MPSTGQRPVHPESWQVENSWWSLLKDAETVGIGWLDVIGIIENPYVFLKKNSYNCRKSRIISVSPVTGNIMEIRLEANHKVLVTPVAAPMVAAPVGYAKSPGYAKPQPQLMPGLMASDGYCWLLVKMKGLGDRKWRDGLAIWSISHLILRQPVPRCVVLESVRLRCTHCVPRGLFRGQHKFWDWEELKSLDEPLRGCKAIQEYSISLMIQVFFFFFFGKNFNKQISCRGSSLGGCMQIC